MAIKRSIKTKPRKPAKKATKVADIKFRGSRAFTTGKSRPQSDNWVKVKPKKPGKIYVQEWKRK